MTRARNVSLGAPIGVVLPFSGTTAPTDWLLCAGQLVNKSDWPALYSAIGANTYGTDTLTQFFLPDLRGRVTAGRDNMNGTAANRITSASGGITATTLGAAGGDARLQAHSHTIPARYNANFWTSGFVQSVDGAGSSTPGVSGTAGDGSSGNVQPTIILNYIIRAA